MAFYEWTDRLSIGDPTIDRQHRVLISYINSLAETMEQHQDPRIITGFLLGKLVTYTKSHFIYEEMLFHAHDYPEFDAHKLYHQNLCVQVEDFHARFRAGDVNLGSDLLDFLMDWLNNHILKSDLAYVQFMDQQKQTKK